MSVTRPRHPGFRCREEGYEHVLPSDCDPNWILDVGAVFDSVSWLRERFPGARIIANNVFDRDLDSVPPEWAERLLGRAEELEGFGPVDLIFMGEVLEHLVYPQEFLERAVKLLPLGGLLLLSTPNLAAWHNRLLLLGGFSPSNYSMLPGRHLGVPRIVTRVAHAGGYGDHIRVFTYKALRELFSAPPWQLVRITARSDVELNRPYHRVRTMLSRLMPPSARETVFVCARLISKDTAPQTRPFGFIGTSARLHKSEPHDAPVQRAVHVASLRAAGEPDARDRGT